MAYPESAPAPFRRSPPQERGQRGQESSDFLQQAREKMEAGAKQREQIKEFVHAKKELFERGQKLRGKLKSNATTSPGEQPKWKAQLERFDAEALQIVSRIHGNERNLSQPKMGSAYEQLLDETERVLREYEQNLRSLEDLLSYHERIADIPVPPPQQQSLSGVSPWRKRVESPSAWEAMQEATSLPKTSSTESAATATPRSRASAAAERLRLANRSTMLEKAEQIVRGREESWQLTKVIKLPDGPLYDRRSGRPLNGPSLLAAQKEAIHRAALAHAMRQSLGASNADITAVLGEPKSYTEQPRPAGPSKTMES